MTELGSVLAAPPPAISADCGVPVDLPDAALSAGAVERLWAADRIALMDCGDKHHAAIEFYAKRDKGLAGK